MKYLNKTSVTNGLLKASFQFEPISQFTGSSAQSANPVIKTVRKSLEKTRTIGTANIPAIC
jgi:hypothetical protein